MFRVAGLSNAQLLEALHHDRREATSAALAGRTQSAEERCVALQSLEAVRVRPVSTVYFGALPGTAMHSTLCSRPPSRVKVSEETTVCVLLSIAQIHPRWGPFSMGYPRWGWLFLWDTIGERG